MGLNGSTPASAQHESIGGNGPPPPPAVFDIGSEDLLTPKQVSELFRVTPKTVARWADEGKIGFTSTIGGHRRYHRTEIRMLLHSLHTPGPKTDPTAS